MHREIGVPLSIALLRVGETRVTHRLSVHDLLFSERQGSERFREQLIARRANRHLAGFRPERGALDPDDVADVDELERSERVIAEAILAKVDLDASRIIREMRKRGLAVPAPRHESSSYPHRRTFLHPFRQSGERLLRRV